MSRLVKVVKSLTTGAPLAKKTKKWIIDVLQELLEIWHISRRFPTAGGAGKYWGQELFISTVSTAG